MTQSDIAISAQGLGKSYKIGHRSEAGRSQTLRDAMIKGVSNFTRKTGDVLRGRPLIAGDTIEEFWALKDVSFEIKRGEAVGIIGHNGAGKSTLLKVLSRITEPSAGQVRIAGRIASLLEVGTGFHPELSGRENIYLNGAVLGMTRAEINRKFDEIVDFAGVEKFLDTPVKRYSSGMYVRLAFSVAAHLEPEILVVDEVLAVGDTTFQQKCLGKMQDVAGQGRTVLFVSHNLAAVEQLCRNGIVLEHGQVAFAGSMDAATDKYRTMRLRKDSFRSRNENSIIKNCRVFTHDSSECASIRSGDDVLIAIDCENPEDNSISVGVSVVIHNPRGELLTVLDSRVIDQKIALRPGINRIKFTIPKLPLTQGFYPISVSLNRNGSRWTMLNDAHILDVQGGDYYEKGKTLPSHLQIAMVPFKVECKDGIDFE